MASMFSALLLCQRGHKSDFGTEKTVLTQIKSENSVREIQRDMQLKVWKVNGDRSEIFLASVKLRKVRDSCARHQLAFC